MAEPRVLQEQEIPNASVHQIPGAAMPQAQRQQRQPTNIVIVFQAIAMVLACRGSPLARSVRP